MEIIEQQMQSEETSVMLGTGKGEAKRRTTHSHESSTYNSLILKWGSLWGALAHFLFSVSPPWPRLWVINITFRMVQSLGIR